MITVAEIHRPEQTEEFRLLWKSLHQRTRHAGLLQSREALEYYIQSQTPAATLRTLVVYAGWQPVGILPLVVRPLPSRLGQLRALTFPTLGSLTCVGPIGPNPTATLVGAFQHLSHAPRDWDVIDLRGIDEEQDRGRTRNALQISGLIATERSWSSLARLSASSLSISEQYQRRHQLREAERKLWQMAPWDYEHLAGNELGSSLDFEKCWRSICALKSTANQSGLRELAGIAAAAECLSCQMIRVNGHVVAALLATLIGSSLQPLDLLIEPGYAAAADVLMGKLLYEDFCSGSPEVTFGRPFLGWAERWGAVRQITRRYTHFSAYRPRAQMLRMARWFQSQDAVSHAEQVDSLPLELEGVPAAVPEERRQLRLVSLDR